MWVKPVVINVITSLELSLELSFIGGRWGWARLTYSYKTGTVVQRDGSSRRSMVDPWEVSVRRVGRVSRGEIFLLSSAAGNKIP